MEAALKGKVAKAQFAVSTYFLFGGTALAIWAVHIPLIQDRTGVSITVLGALLILGGIGSISAMQLAGLLIDKIGAKTTTVAGGVMVGLSLFGPAFAVDAFTLGLAIILLSFGLAAVDVPMNAAALQVEALAERAIFSAFHAYWSLGGIVGAGLGGLLIAAKVDFTLSLTVAGLAMAVASLAVGGWLLPNAPAPKASTKDEGQQARLANRSVLGLVVLAGLMSASAAVVEGISNDWSALYYVEIVGTSEAVAASGLAIFSAGMVIGRLTVDRIVERYGRGFVIRGGAGVAVIMVLILVFVPEFWTASGAWFGLGLALSGIVPQIFALAGNIGEPSHAGRNLAKVVGLTYMAVVIGPGMIGLLAGLVPLNIALSWAAVLALFVFLAEPWLRRSASK